MILNWFYYFIVMLEGMACLLNQKVGNQQVFTCTKEKLDDNFDRLIDIYKLKIEQVSPTQGALCNYNPLKKFTAYQHTTK